MTLTHMYTALILAVLSNFKPICAENSTFHNLWEKCDFPWFDFKENEQHKRTISHEFGLLSYDSTENNRTLKIN